MNVESVLDRWCGPASVHVSLQYCYSLCVILYCCGTGFHIGSMESVLDS